MNKKGFTLMELLAVIVILAIIALIATPTILGIIKDSKEESNKRSIEMYADALKNSIAQYQLSGKKLEVSTLETTDGRNFINKEDFKVDYDGDVVCKTIEVYEDGNIYLEECKVNKEDVKYTYGEEGEFHLAKKNVRPAIESKTGIVPTQDSNGNITPGSEFKIKVSDTILDEKGDIAEYSFFVLSNSEDGKYVNLIAEQNITIDGIYTEEPQEGDEWYLTSDNSYDNRYGPQTSYKYLSKATSNWTNVPIIENFNYADEGNQNNSLYGYQSIVTELNKTTGKYITTIIPYSSDYGNPVTYENMRARLPKYSEVISSEVGCTTSSGSCPLWMVNYLNSTRNNYGYWLLSSSSGYSSNARNLYYDRRIHGDGTNDAIIGMRPVITVLKSDLLRVM